jgi:hypothetical protein
MLESIQKDVATVQHRANRNGDISHEQDPVKTCQAWMGRMLLRDYLQVTHTLYDARSDIEMGRIYGLRFGKKLEAPINFLNSWPMI